MSIAESGGMFIKVVLAIGITFILCVVTLRISDHLTESNLLILGWIYSVIILYLFHRMTKEKANN